jgi:hypothetical protein
MVHIGTKKYYGEIFSRLSDCDLVLFEGVDSFRIRLLTTSYRWVAKRARLNLATQSQCLKLGDLGVRLVHADITKKQFDQGWHEIPMAQRMALTCFSPIYGLWLYLTASRESLGTHLALDDLPSRNDALRHERTFGVEHALLGSRNSKLVSCIDEVMQKGVSQRIGVVYGAAHMHYAIHHLMAEHSYQISSCHWITVMGYED